MYKQASIPRNELLAWINDILCTNYIKLEDASNGTFGEPALIYM